MRLRLLLPVALIAALSGCATTDDGSPSWAEIFLTGAADIMSARAGVPPPSRTTVSSRPVSSQSKSAGVSAAGQSAANWRAPLAPATCASYRATRYEALWDSAAIEWRNNCNFPIEVHWCWVPAGRTTCKTDNASNKLAPGATQTAVGPTGVRNPVAAYYVCNATEGKLCSGWD